MNESLEQLIAMVDCPKCGQPANMGLVRAGFGSFSKTCTCDNCGILTIELDSKTLELSYF